MGLKSTIAAALSAAAILSGLSTAARADTLPQFYLEMTETLKGFTFLSNLPTYPGAPQNFYDPSPNHAPGEPFLEWYFGETDGGFLLGSFYDGQFGDPIVDAIVWTSPEAPKLYNVFYVVPSGNHLNLNFTLIGNVPLVDLGYLDPSISSHCSYFGLGPYPCPDLANGESYLAPFHYDLPNYGGIGVGQVNVTFKDEVGVPEPGVWALMLLGIGVLGLALRSRRRQPALVA